MKPLDSNLPRLLAASVFALTCFGVGYLVPHPFVALGQAPHPTYSLLDDVPGGGKGTHQGQQTVTVMFGTTEWSSCAGKKKCNVTFAFRTAAQGAKAPKKFACSAKNCYTFAGSGFTYSALDPYTDDVVGQQYYNVQMTGMLQFQPK